ncbi:MAG: Gfo/Idh/MocA family oxidoreductase [Clostridiales bacterium]|nr:Gfo/Idh/MocA family oxidoreductase [Clostridiales bacterium]
MKWCVIGAGGIADRRTIPAILKDEKSQLVAVMDRVKETAERIGNKYNVVYFTDEETMLKSIDCDAVYIGTPVFSHYNQAMLALKYGKHVFVEKPIAMNVKEGEELANAFKKAGKLLCVGYMMKYHNLHEKAKRIVKSGGIGAVNDVRAQFSCWYPEIKGAWRQNKSLGGGGAVMDLGVHCIELIEDLLDEEIVDVKAFYSTKTFSYEVDDGAVIIFKTKSGTLGHIDVNFNIPDNASESKLELYGDKGYVVCTGTLAQEEKGKLCHLYSPQGEYVAAQNRTTDKPEEYLGEDGNLYLKQIIFFRENIESGKLDYFYTDRAVQVQKIVEKIYNEN